MHAKHGMVCRRRCFQKGFPHTLGTITNRTPCLERPFVMWAHHTKVRTCHKCGVGAKVLGLIAYRITVLSVNSAVSRSEAGQDKALLVVDRTKGWQVVEEVPLDFGPRHFDAALQPAAGQNGNGGDPARALVLPEGLRRGDRVRVALPRDEVAAQKKAIKQLAAKGVAVEVVTLPSSETAAPRIENAELLRPMELFKQYTEVRGMSPTALARGVALLEGVAGGGAEGAAVAAAAHRSVSLAFNAVEVEGYFSFKEAQRYELADRGLVVVTGQVGGGASGEESSGMESNGAGKTALVMAPLWAITGDVDARSEVSFVTHMGETTLFCVICLHHSVNISGFLRITALVVLLFMQLGGGRGLTNADVVNEDAKFARVRVEGTVDGVPFSVERKVVRKGRGGGLTFELDGEDRTTQEIKLTQAAIDAALAAPLIGRAVFYGQSEITALLESGDRAFKEELGKVVDLDVWADAKEASRRVLSEKKTALDGCRRGEEREKADVAKFSAELARARREEEELQGAWQMNWAQAQHQAIEVATELHQAYVALQQELETVRAWMQQHQVHVQGGDESGAATAELVELDAELANVKAIMILREEELKQRSQAHSEAQKTQAAAQAHARGQQQRLEKFLTLGGDAAVCDRCLQPIDKPQFDEQVEQLTEKRQKAEGEAAACDAEVSVAAGLMQEAAQLFDSLRDEYSGLLQRRAGIVAQAKEAARAKAREHAEAESAVDMGEQAAAAAADCLDHLQSLLSSENPGWAAAAPLQPGGTSSVAMLRQTAQAVQTLIQAAQSSIREVDVLRRQQQSQNLQAQIQKLQAWVAEAEAKATSLSSQSDELAAEIEDLKAVDDAFKSTGVVSFVLEGALAALQDSASRHLAQLAPGITLELSATRPRASAGAKADSGSIEQVEKRIFVRLPGSNDLRARSVKQLSGGERRRVALALALGFTELAAHRGRLRCNLLVLDEVMQHLDGEGCARFAGLLRGLEEFSTVLLVAQAQSFMTQVFDAVDVVVKSGDGKDSPGSVIMQQGAASLPELVGVAD